MIKKYLGFFTLLVIGIFLFLISPLWLIVLNVILTAYIIFKVVRKKGVDDGKEKKETD